MSERNQNKPYDWKKETLRERRSNTWWRRFGKTVIAAGLITGGITMLGSDNRTEAIKYLSDLVHAQDKNEISVADNQNVIASDVITINKDETLAVDATQSFEKMAANHNIDKNAIPYQEIQSESRQAQDENNAEHISYPGDQYETKMIESQDGKIEVSVDPLDKFKLK